MFRAVAVCIMGKKLEVRKSVVLSIMTWGSTERDG